MDDKQTIKAIFTVNAVTIISDTADEKTGEASIGYNYSLDTSLPELAFAVSGFLKAIDADEDMSKVVEGSRTVGDAFITLLQQYYSTSEQ